MDGSTWMLLLGGSLIASLISGACGFGGGVILLPALSFALGPKEAIPVLTVAQILGNLARVALGFREIRWRPVGAFLVGALPACAIGAALLQAADSRWISVLIGAMILVVIATRRTKWIRTGLSERWLVVGGVVVGLLSALAGSAGPLSASLFLSLGLSPVGYVATEAATGLSIHATKAAVYHSDGLLGRDGLSLGLMLGAVMVVGTWCGKQIIRRIPRERFGVVMDVILAAVAVQMLAAAVRLDYE